MALARALNLKVDYFFRSSRVAIAGLEFREKSRLSKKAEGQIKYQTLDFLQKYLEVEEILNIPPGFDNPITDNTELLTSGILLRYHLWPSLSSRFDTQGTRYKVQDIKSEKALLRAPCAPAREI